MSTVDDEALSALGPTSSTPAMSAGASPDPDPRTSHLHGLILAIAGVVVLSPDAAIVQSISESTWTILGWRGLLTAISLTLLVAVMSRGRVRSAFLVIGPIGVVVAIFQTGAGLAFISSVRLTNAANVLVIYSAAPLLAALLGRIFLGEAVPRRTWVAIACIVGAVVAVFWGSLSAEGLLGDVIALFGATFAAIATIGVRRRKGISMIPAMVLAACFSCAIGLALGAEVPAQENLGLIAFQGMILAPMAIALITSATRYLRAAEVSLTTRLELVLGPIWVWVVLGVTPGPGAIVGGIVIVTTLFVHTMLALRSPDDEPDG